MTAHPPGIFCWPELATTDCASAAAFYGALFEWAAVDVSSSEHDYRIFQREGLDVGAAYTMGPLESSKQPHWKSYVSVGSADEVAARTPQFGGSVLADPFDVSNIGRTAVLQDRAGATFCVWEARTHIGARLLNGPGALCWTELVTANLESAEDFYTRLFDWTAKRRRTADYVDLFCHNEPVAGILQRPASDVPPHWLPYFAVDDLDDVVELVRKHAGTVIVAPSDIPMAGRFAVLRDPHGARFGVYGVNEAA